jgi:hypothetical protein
VSIKSGLRNFHNRRYRLSILLYFAHLSFS